MAQADPDAHIQHRCAVCWEFQATHNLWRQHAEDIHGAEMLLFGYGICPAHVRLKHEGQPPVQKWNRPQPVKAKDGNHLHAARAVDLMHGTGLRLSVYAALIAGLVLSAVCVDTSHAQEPYTADDTFAAIDQASSEMGVSAALLTRVVRCETGGTFDPYSRGRQGELGAAQLHPRGLLPTFYAWGYADPFSPYQSIRFLAQEITYGHIRAWSCA